VEASVASFPCPKGHRSSFLHPCCDCRRAGFCGSAGQPEHRRGGIGPADADGQQPYFTYAGSQAIDSNTGIAVNVASGDLLVQGQIVRIAGTGLDLNIARAYNSESAEGSTDFGGLWAMESAADVKVIYNTPVSGDATFYGPSGYSNVLTPNGSGGFNAANGLNATLVHNGSGTSTLTFFETGEVYSFNSSGQLTSDADKHGNTVTYGYSSGNLSTITDTRKRTLNVTTNSWGEITKIADPTGRSWNYGYRRGRQHDHLRLHRNPPAVLDHRP
jgi:YD repeat-containing protein